MQAADIVIGCVKILAHRWIRQHRRQRRQVRHRQGIDQRALLRSGDLQQTDLFLVVVHGIGFEIDRQCRIVRQVGEKGSQLGGGGQDGGYGCQIKNSERMKRISDQ